MVTDIQVISFDADQTLFDFNRVMREALQKVSLFLADEAKVQCEWQELRRTRDRIERRFEGQAVDMLTLRRLSFEEVLSDHPDRQELVEKAMSIFTTHRFGNHYFCPDAVKVLTELKKTYRLALLTNGNSDPTKAGIGELFDVILLGENFAYKKPDPRIFEALMSTLKVSDASRIMHVGDSLTDDVGGANQAGLTSVWFNPRALNNQTNITPDHEIAKLRELQECLMIGDQGT